MKRLKQPAPIPPGHFGITDPPILRMPFALTWPLVCQACGEELKDELRAHCCPQMQQWIEDNNPDAFEEVDE